MTRASAAFLKSESHSRETIHVTLLELVSALSEITSDEDEVVATVLHMLRSGRARLCGSFAGEAVERLAS